MSSSLYTFCLTALSLSVVSTLVDSVISWYRLKKIPGARLLGSSIWLLLPGVGYYYQFVKILRNARTILRDAHVQHRNAGGGAWKIPEMKGWHIIITGREMFREMINAEDDVLSSTKALDESVSIRYLMGESIPDSPYQVSVVRGPLTRNIGSKFAEIYEEIREAFQDELPPSSDWTGVNMSSLMKSVVARTTNRVFVGLPLCRDPTWLNLNIDFTVDMVKSAVILAMFPPFLRPWIAPLLRACPRKIETARKILEPIIKERMEHEDKFGQEWDKKPNDLLTWLLDFAPEEFQNLDDITRRVISLNFGAIHTTAMTVTSALVTLAAYREYIQPLREEIEAAVEELGWTKAGVAKMIKLDSFLKETMRMNCLFLISVTRKVVKDFTFSNGTRVPSGTFLSVPIDAIHHDETIYTDHTTFNGFRFVELQQSSEGDWYKHHMSTLSPDFLLFGHGKHACPGRFFAVAEMKAIMAHILVTYDIELEDGKRVPPQPTWFGPA